MKRSVTYGCRIGAMTALVMMPVAVVVMAEDVTVQGKTYANVRADRVEPDGVMITHSGGIRKLDFADLPADWQRRYGYDPDKAAAYRDLLRRQQEYGKQGRPLSREESVKRTLELTKLKADLEIVEMKSDGAETAGTFLTAKTVQRRETNDQGKVWSVVETRMVEQPLGFVVVLGLSPPLMKGSRWSGTIYPLDRKRDGRPMYAVSREDAVALSLTGELPKRSTQHPFLMGLGDGLSWPFRYFGCWGLTFAPTAERELRYWCGAIIGGCAYLIVFFPFMKKRKLIG